MKTRTIALSTSATLLLACNALSARLEPTSTTERPAAATLVPAITSPSPPDQGELATLPATIQYPASPAADQEELKDEWRPFFHSTWILFDSCQLMFETQARFVAQEIDMTGAGSALATISDAVDSVVSGYDDWENPGEAVAPHRERLEDLTEVLVDLLHRMESGGIVTDQVVADNLFDTCSSLFDLENDAASAAMEAGLTVGSLDELDYEIADLLRDLWDQVLGEG
jgi:hypothetical protein